MAANLEEEVRNILVKMAEEGGWHPGGRPNPVGDLKHGLDAMRSELRDIKKKLADLEKRLDREEANI